jgi:outer membrane protein with beta-barrel domain
MRVLRTVVTAAVLAAVGACCAPAARAQEQPKPIRLYLGAYFPSNSDTQDAIGDVQFSWGLSYDIPQKKPLPAVIAVYFDGVWASSDEFRGLDVDFHYLGIGPMARYYVGKKGEAETQQKSRFYVGGGFGIYWITAQVVDNAGFYVSTIDNDIKFGGKLLAGVEFGKSFLVEGDYTWPGASKGNGFNVRAGFRF